MFLSVTNKLQVLALTSVTVNSPVVLADYGFSLGVEFLSVDCSVELYEAILIPTIIQKTDDKGQITGIVEDSNNTLVWNLVATLPNTGAVHLSNELLPRLYRASLVGSGKASIVMKAVKQGEYSTADANSSGGGGGSVNWGGIGGSIFNQTDLQNALNLKANQSTTYTKTEVDTSLNLKADQSTTYTKTEVDTSLNLKADQSTTYTKTEVDTSLNLKADQSTTYTKTEVDTSLNLKENTITAGTTSQYYRGDKTFQTLNKSVVDLSNVDNTSDLNKPISTDTQTALNLKADQSTTYTKTEIDGTFEVYQDELDTKASEQALTTGLTSVNNALVEKQDIIGSFAEFTIDVDASVIKDDDLNLSKAKGTSDITLDNNIITLPGSKTFEIYTKINTDNTSYLPNQEAIFGFRKIDNTEASMETLNLSFNLTSQDKTALYTTLDDDLSKKLKLSLINSDVAGWKETELVPINIDYVGISAIEISKDDSTIVIVDYTPNYPSTIYIFGIDVNNKPYLIQKITQIIQTEGRGLVCYPNATGSKIFIGARYDNKVAVYEKVNGVYEMTHSIVTPSGNVSFGQSIACTDDGNKVVISAHGMNAVFVYEYDVATNQYIQFAKITANNSSALGYGLTCSSDATWIGCSDNNKSLRIFKYTPSVEMEYQEKVKLPDLAYDSSLNSDGSIVAYSTAITTVGNTIANIVYIFQRGSSDIQWVQKQRFEFPISTHNGYGYSVDLSADGNTLIVATKNLIVNGLVTNGVMYVYKTADNWNTSSVEMVQPNNISPTGIVGHSCAVSSNGNFFVEGGNKVRLYQKQNAINNLDVAILTGSKIYIKETAKDDKVSSLQFNNLINNIYTKAEIEDKLLIASDSYYSTDNVKLLYSQATASYIERPVAFDVNGEPLLDAFDNYVLENPLGYSGWECQPMVPKLRIDLTGSTLSTNFQLILPDLADLTTIFQDDDKTLNLFELFKNTSYYKTLDRNTYPTDEIAMSWYFDKDTIDIKIEPLKTLPKVAIKIANNKKIKQGSNLRVPQVEVGSINTPILITFIWDGKLKTWETSEIV